MTPRRATRVTNGSPVSSAQARQTSSILVLASGRMPATTNFERLASRLEHFGKNGLLRPLDRPQLVARRRIGQLNQLHRAFRVESVAHHHHGLSGPHRIGGPVNGRPVRRSGRQNADAQSRNG